MGNFKQIGTLMLCGLLFMRVMLAPIIFFSYEFNKTYIIENYCINKNRPQLHCDGKCYLAQQLQAAQEKEENQSKIVVYKLWLEIFYQASDITDKQPIKLTIHQSQNYLYQNNYHHSRIFSLFKPPQG
ncbi:hypothetical protein [Emticicia fontis]